MVTATEPAVPVLFPGFGIELEYMIVDRATGYVLPVCDEVLRAQAGEITSDVEFADICWSNELVLHVIELKTSGPAVSLKGLAGAFGNHVERINRLLDPLGACLMPTGMHPWMDPASETRLWPHDCNEVYAAFNRIFGCSGHGWSNLQSVHLNLPFTGDERFGRLHAAIRLVLPILPALAASSPIIDGRITGMLDSRLDVYRTNCAKIPSLTGDVIPEPVFRIGDYKSQILERLYRDIAPHDPDGILQDEFLNARGAIARFVRDTIEIRVIDAQECPAADLAVCAAAIEVVAGLIRERWCDYREQRAWAIEPLKRILLDTITDGERAVITDGNYLYALGIKADRCTAREVWSHLAAQVASGLSEAPELDAALQVMVREGPLARRILNAVGGDLRHERLAEVYRQLCRCLATGTLFSP